MVRRIAQFSRIPRLSRAYANLRERPGPIPLPKKDQEEFERLQKEAAEKLTVNPATREVFAEFEGETNPTTGEVGGPKQDPLRHGDWAFNGKVTDF